jgi:hypothetical protein
MPAAIINVHRAARVGSTPALRPGDSRYGGRVNGRGGHFERLTVNITRRASRALDLLTKLTGDTKTDSVNRALQVYAYMEQVTAHGGSVYIRRANGSRLERLKVF